MGAITEAEKALAQNWRTVAFYVVSVVALVAAFDLTHGWLRGLVPEDVSPKPVWYAGTTFAMDILIAAGIAALQSVAFASIGSEIDRPLWKSEGSRHALRRYFPLWFIIALISLAFIRIEISFGRQGLLEAAGAMMLPHFVWSGAYIPIGACIMYGGPIVWNEIPDRLMPIIHVFPKALAAFALGFLQFFVWYSLIPLSPSSVFLSTIFVAVLNLALLLMECLGFAVMWHVCMEARDTAGDRDDDFDL